MGKLEKLRELRKAKGYTQKELAAELRIAQPQVNSYEKGVYEPDINMLKRMASLFETSVDYIVGNTDVQRPIEAFSEYSLSDTEKELVDSFRQLTKGHREGLVSFVKTLTD